MPPPPLPPENALLQLLTGHWITGATHALARLGAVEALPALKKQLEKAKTPEQKELYEAAVNALER